MARTDPPKPDTGEDRYGRAGTAGGMSLDAALAAAGGDEAGPIGVPVGYTFTPDSGSYPYNSQQGSSWHTPSSGVYEPIAPKYFEGDQYEPNKQGPQEIWRQQQMLAKMGLLTGKFIQGVWDPATANAWKSVLAYANQRGLNDKEAFINLAKMAMGETDMEFLPYSPGRGLFEADDMGNIQPAGLTELPPLIYRTTDPRVVKAVMRQAALSLTGSGMDEDQLNSAATAFNALERKRDRDMYNAQYVNPNPKGTTVVDAPSVEAFADQYLRDTEPGEVEEHAGLGFAQDAMTLLTSPAWGS